MPETHLSFAKIVTTPTESSWAQAYNAGNLFAVLSLAGTPSSGKTLHEIGKAIFNNLEAEFFPLEEKNLASIKVSLTTVCQEIPKELTVSFCAVFVKDTILYVFIIHLGKVILRRGGELGVILSGTTAEEEENRVFAASGFLEDGDTIFLETEQFSSAVSLAHLSETNEAHLPNEIAEILTPLVHKTDAPSASAIILSYKGIKANWEEQTDETLSEEKTSAIFPPLMSKVKPTLYPTIETQEDEIVDQNPPRRFGKITLSSFSRIFSFHLFYRPKISISPSRLIYGSLFLVLLIILFMGVFWVKKHEEEQKTQAFFQQVYPAAQKNYDEGIGLLTLNRGLSQDDFQAAKKALSTNRDKFPLGSKEREQVNALLQKVQDQLSSGKNETSVSEAVSTDSPLLALEEKHQGAVAVESDGTNAYILSQNNITSIPLSSGNGTVSIKNNDDWQKPVGLSTYEGNLYLLDQKAGVLKYVPADGGFSKTNYFKSSSPDLSQATSLSIDGSIYILTSSNILQYTSGTADSFTVSGLDKPFNHPTRIVTTIDMKNLYVLDSGNSRLVVLNKSGAFQTEYTASVLKTARDIDVSEKNKQVIILSGGKLYKMALQ